MNTKIILTAKEKIMNTEKSGRVSCVQNILKNMVMDCISYTLCVY